MYRCQTTDCKPLVGIYRTPTLDQEAPSLPDGYSGILEDEAYVMARDKGLLILGSPGVGKTHFAKQLVVELRKNGHVVEVIAKTHSAVRNFGIEGCYTADHWVIRHIKKGRPRCQYLVIEELSMINSTLWCHLALAKMYGLIFIVCGDFNQFGPICDSFAGCQVPEDKLEHSQLLLDLVGGNRLRLYRNWRSDPVLFDFYTSIKPEANGLALESKLEEARRLFPARERDADTALCISHKQRMYICGKMNKKNIPKDSIFLRAPKNANFRNSP